MKRLAPLIASVLLTSLALLSPATCPAQSSGPLTPEDAAARKALLLANLQALEVSAAGLDQPIARAAARAEIASAAWTLDEDWSKRRLRLGMISNLVRRYAPEMTPAFGELERLSRTPGQDAPLRSMESYKEDSEKQYERRVREAMASDHLDEMVIESIISRGDLDKARKLIAKLDDGPQKDQLVQSLDAHEALALLSKGDALAAEQIAERLRNVVFVLQVYPPLVRACVAAKDEGCPARLVHKAVRQLRGADTTPLAPPAGIPASVFPSNRELDRALMALSQLAAQVTPASDALALELLEEIVEAANRSEMDTGMGRTGFDSEVFRLVAAHNEDRARQAAEEFKDRLREIVALAAIDQAKAEELSRKPKAHGDASKQGR